jgi:hypothetical protein
MDRILMGYSTDKEFLKAKENRFTRCGFWFQRNGRQEDRICVPGDAKLRRDIIKESHAPPYMGHTGRTRTAEQVARSFVWPGLNKDVETFISSCKDCQRNKASTRKPGGLLQPLEIPTGFWECVTMDLITALPPTTTGYDALAVFVDKLSKMTHIVPCRTTITAEQFAELYVSAVVRHHGLSSKLVSDRDARFTGHFFAELCRLMGITQAKSTAFHPQTDGQTERMNRVVEDMIRHYVGPYHDDWDKSLPLIEFAINNSWQASIQCTPFRAHQGYDPKTPLTGEISHRCPAAQAFWDKHTERRDHCIKCLTHAQDRQKHYSDLRRRDVKYSQGQWVYLSTKNVKFRSTGTPKFLPRFIGPFQVEHVYGPRDLDGVVTTVTACRLSLPPLMKIHPVFHVALMKEYIPDAFCPGTPGSGRELPLTYDLDGSPTWEVDCVVKERQRKVKKKFVREFLIQWKNFGPEQETWEDASVVLMCAPQAFDHWQKYALRDFRCMDRDKRRAAAARFGER